MLAAAALLVIVIFGLVIVLWPVIGRLVVLALAIVLISALIQMLKANAAELLQPEHIYRYKGGCDIDNSRPLAPCYILDFHYPNHLRKLVFMFSGLSAFYAYTGYDDQHEASNDETLTIHNFTRSGFLHDSDATGHCTITAISTLPTAISCTATMPAPANVGWPIGTHFTISNHMTNITD